MQIVKTTHYWNNLLTGAINPALAAPLLLAAAKSGLGTAVITPNPATTLTDCAEATFIGYAQSATIVWGLPVNEADGSQTAFAPSHLFRATAGTTPNTINNFFVTDGATGCLGAGQVTPPIFIVNTGDGFSLNLAWNEGLATVNSSATILT